MHWVDGDNRNDVKMLCTYVKLITNTVTINDGTQFNEVEFEMFDFIAVAPLIMNKH